VHVLVEPPVIAQAAAARGDFVVVRDHGAAVAHHREVLRRIERKDRGAAEAADDTAAERRAVRLRAVFEHPEAVAARELPHGRNVERVTIEMHGKHADGPRRDLGRGVRRVHRVVVVRVDEDRRRVGEADRLDGRKRRMRGDEDLVAGLDAECPQRQPEPGRGRGREHAVADADVARQLLFELFGLRSENPLTRVHGGHDRLLDFVVDGRTRQRDRAHDVAPEELSPRRRYLPRK
jgi:hypothetical protein